MNINEIKELTREYKYKIELHAHTRPASPCSDMTPQMLIERYSTLGFDGVALTNHFVDYLITESSSDKASDIYLRDYYETKNCGEKNGIRVYLGMEVRFPESFNDYLIYGIDEGDIKEIFSYIHSDYITFYKGFKNERNVILQAHPYRSGMELQNPDYLDGIETFNMHPGHNSRIGFATRYAEEHGRFIKTCGTDFHHEGHQGLGATLMKKLPCDSFEIAEILKKRDYLFNIAGSIVIP